MLQRGYQLYGPVSVCVCLSQVGVLSKRMNESSWFLAWELQSTYPTLCCKEIHYLQNKGTSLKNFPPNSGLRKFRHGMSIIEACYQLSSRKADAQTMINWTVVGQLSHNTSELRRSTTVVYRTDRQARSGYSTILSRPPVSDS